MPTVVCCKLILTNSPLHDKEVLYRHGAFHYQERLDPSQAHESVRLVEILSRHSFSTPKCSDGRGDFVT